MARHVFSGAVGSIVDIADLIGGGAGIEFVEVGDYYGDDLGGGSVGFDLAEVSAVRVAAAGLFDELGGGDEKESFEALGFGE